MNTIDLTKHQTTIIPSRTRFQLQNFVIGQHDTKPMQWRQLLLEVQDILYKIRCAEIAQAKNHIEYERLIKTEDPIDALDAEQKQLDMILLERTLTGAKLELEWLTELAAEVGEYTPEEIEADQPNYWRKRLQRQADIEALGASERVDPATLMSMLQTGLIRKEDQCAISPTG